MMSEYLIVLCLLPVFNVILIGLIDIGNGSDMFLRNVRYCIPGQSTLDFLVILLYFSMCIVV
jgi:hypothetical protein